jgi:hypothetical protein
MKNTDELFVKAAIEIKETLDRLRGFSKTLATVQREIDGDISALRELLYEIEELDAALDQQRADDIAAFKSQRDVEIEDALTREGA